MYGLYALEDNSISSCIICESNKIERRGTALVPIVNMVGGEVHANTDPTEKDIYFFDSVECKCVECGFKWKVSGP